LLRRESQVPREPDPARLEGVDRVVVGACVVVMILGAIALLLVMGAP